MSFDGLMLYYLIRELKPKIINSKINKIYYNNKKFIFEVYNKKVFFLKVDLSPQSNRFHIDFVNNEKNHEINFLLLLKKHLLRSRIVSIQQYNSDRVLILEFHQESTYNLNKSHYLILEFMGKNSNAYLTDKAYNLFGTYRQKNTDTRKIFKFHESRKIPFTDMKKIPSSPVEIFEKYEGLSPETSRKIYEYQVLPLEINVSPTIFKNKLSLFDMDGGKRFSSINEIMKYEFDKTKPLNKYLKKINYIIKLKSNKLIKLNNEIENNKDNFKLQNEAENLLRFENIKLKRENLYGIKLNPKIRIIDNINLKFKKYKKAKRAILKIKEQIEITNNEIDFFNSLVFNIETNTITSHELDKVLLEKNLQFTKIKNKNKTKLKKYLEISEQDYVIFLGKNAYQNNIVTHKIAKPKDYFFHVKNAQGSHVIYRGSILSQGFNIAAKLAALHSKLKYSKNIPINYTMKKNVKKIPGIHGSKVMLTKYKTLFVNLDEKFVNIWDNKYKDWK